MLQVMLFLWVVASPLFAHDMYMWPRFEEKNQVSLAMFVAKDEVIWFESMTAGLRMDGPSGEAELTVPEDGDPKVTFDREGTYVIGWESAPTFIKVEPDIFKKYIVMEGYKVVIDFRKKNHQEDIAGREFYTRYIKTFVQVGPNITNDFNRPFGYKIEIIPLQNPAALTRQSDFDVQVLFEGRPLPDHRVMATYDSYSTLPEDYAQVTQTDKDGIARFRITQKGLWLIRSNEIVHLENNPEADWHSFWANLTFEVK